MAGEADVLLVAPHGGSSAQDLVTKEAAGRRANDLHTADLARQLARDLSATALINPTCDRNVLDLNRLDDLVRRAPWMLVEIERHLERLLARHASVLVLFVHGWHVGQARCDIGIGARLETAADADAKADRLTVAPDFVRGPLETFRRRLDADGVCATYGERWPAAHRNNPMRLFRRAPSEQAPSPRIQAWAEEGRVGAVQLELGVPLRWPGRVRARFVEQVAAVWGEGGPPSPMSPRPRREAATRGEPPSALSLQVFDPSAGDEGLGLIVGAMRLGEKDVGARVQLLPGGRRMGIFTGHGRVGPILGVPDLEFHVRPDGFDVHFDGWLLHAEDLERYFRFEDSQAAARLVEARVDLSYREVSGGVGVVRGWVEEEGRRRALAATGFADVRSTVIRGARPGTKILAGFPDGHAVRIEGPDDEGRWTIARNAGQGWAAERHGQVVASDTSESWALSSSEGVRIDARVRSRGSLLRPIGPKRYAHTTFGLVEVAFEGRTGAGFFERRRPL